MPFHFESSVGPNHGKYLEGCAACVKGESREEAPFEDKKSPEALAWLEGFDAVQKQKEIAKLEELYNRQ